MRVFISHSSKDVELIKILVELLRASLNLPATDIRCTSLEGYRLAAGADTDTSIRAEIEEAEVFVAVLSEPSLSSLYVAFELGARWGARKPLLPLLAPGLKPDIISRPLSALNVLRCDLQGDVHHLVFEMGRLLNITPQPPASYQRYVEAIALPLPTSQSATDKLSTVEKVSRIRKVRGRIADRVHRLRDHL